MPLFTVYTRELNCADDDFEDNQHLVQAKDDKEARKKLKNLMKKTEPSYRYNSFKITGVVRAAVIS